MICVYVYNILLNNIFYQKCILLEVYYDWNNIRKNFKTLLRIYKYSILLEKLKTKI